MAKIAVSACLLGHCCKYNGGHNRNQAVLDFLEGCAEEALPVCPETAGGLPRPRPPGGNSTGRTGDGQHRQGRHLCL